jgi:hypothetical protein
VKPVDKDSKGIGYIRQTFSEVSEAKMIDWICKLNNYFKTNSTERRAWKAFESNYRNFLGNEKVKNWSEIVQELISPYSAIVIET